jgi:hypothetical protein
MYVTGALYVTTGSVGIGTTSPLGSLNIQGLNIAQESTLTNPAGITLGVQSTQPRISLDNGGGAANVAGNQWNIDNSASGVLRFFTAGSVKMYVSSSGNIGVGNTNPQANIHIGPSLNTVPASTSIAVAGDTSIRFMAGSDGNANYGSFIAGTQVAGVRALSLGYRQGAGDITTMTITELATGTGSVGIGTSSPKGNLEVAAPTPIIISGASSAASLHGLEFRQSNTLDAYIKQLPATGEFRFYVGRSASWGGNMTFYTDTVNRMSISSAGAVNIVGSLSKGSGTFKIDHPLESKKDTNYLVHSFVEGPRADLIYRGTVTLVNGTATINIDTSAGMTEGTFVALNRETQFFITNQSGWNNIKGSLHGNILTIEAEDTNSTDTIAWMVVGERQDKHIKETDWTDSNGKPILEPAK